MGLLSFLFSSKKKTESRQSSVRSCPFHEPYIILGVETTGLYPSTDKIIQLSAIKYSTQGIPLVTYDTYLNPGVPIPSRITNLTGITDETVQNAPTVEQVRGAFLGFLSNLTIIGYNVNLDLRFLSAAFGDTLNGRNYIDAKSIAHMFFHCSDDKLSTVATECGFVPNGNFHNSLVDCEAVAFILSLVEDFPIAEYSKTFHISDEKPRHFEVKYPAYSNLKLSEIFPQTLNFDHAHPFFGKSIVFTGTLRMPRAEAAQLAVNVGAFVKSEVSSKTDFLVVGSPDINFVDDEGMSKKQKTALTLNQAGKAHVEVICENEFLQLLRN